MTSAQRPKRSHVLREIGESKIDMGLLAPMSQQALEMSLYMAVVEDDHEAVLSLKDSGVNPCMMADGKLGEPAGTLLHFAARHASLRTVAALLKIGADPAMTDEDGKTPYEAAADRPGSQRIRSVLEMQRERTMSQAPQQDDAVYLDLLDKVV